MNKNTDSPEIVIPDHGKGNLTSRAVLHGQSDTVDATRWDVFDFQASAGVVRQRQLDIAVAVHAGRMDGHGEVVGRGIDRCGRVAVGVSNLIPRRMQGAEVLGRVHPQVQVSIRRLNRSQRRFGFALTRGAAFNPAPVAMLTSPLVSNESGRWAIPLVVS